MQGRWRSATWAALLLLVGGLSLYAVDNITLSNITGNPVMATQDIGGLHYQYSIRYTIGRADTFTVPANGTAIDLSASIPVSRFTLQVKGTGGTPTAWSVALEGSLDGTTYTTLLTHISGEDVDGSLALQGLSAPVKYFRSRLVSITLGPASNVVVTILGAE